MYENFEKKDGPSSKLPFIQDNIGLNNFSKTNNWIGPNFQSVGTR